MERGLKAAANCPTTLPLAETLPRQQPVRILSLDAGGIRGILELNVLAELEERSGKPISELFDLITGTSTGSVIGISLLLPGPDGKPLHSAHEMLDLYVQQIRTFGEGPWYHPVLTLDGLLGPEYRTSRGVAFLRDVMGTTTMAELLCDIVIPAASIDDLSPRFMTSRRSPDGSDFTINDNIVAANVALATTAAPGLIAPMRLRNVEGQLLFTAADGGLFAYDPTPLAISLALQRYPDRSLIVLSLGTGDLETTIDTSSAGSWGSIHWLKHATSLGIRPSVRYTNAILSHVAGRPGSQLTHYLRINPKVPSQFNQSLYSSKEVVTQLNQIGAQSVKDNDQAISEIISLLSKNETEKSSTAP